MLNNANLLEELLSWLQWAETTLVQRDTEPLPQDIPELKNLITEHQVGFRIFSTTRPVVIPLAVRGSSSQHCRCLWLSDVYGGDDEEAAGRGQSHQELQEEAG